VAHLLGIRENRSPYRESVQRPRKGARRKWGGDILMPPGSILLCV
jgi:hypothetical protein